MILRTSAVAACCSRASLSSRVSRATGVIWSIRDGLRRGGVLGALRPFRFNVMRGRALAGLLAALERFFIASTRAIGTRHRSG
jgi:hypothetical protein